MKSRDFCYWLQGWFELNGTVDHRDGATPETMAMIKNHLAMVFKHDIDPSNGDKKHNEELSEIHKGQVHIPRPDGAGGSGNPGDRLVSLNPTQILNC
jgi:hypothetical protein